MVDIFHTNYLVACLNLRSICVSPLLFGGEKLQQISSFETVGFNITKSTKTWALYRGATPPAGREMLRDMKRVSNLGFVVFPFFPWNVHCWYTHPKFHLKASHNRLSSFEKNMIWECTFHKKLKPESVLSLCKALLNQSIVVPFCNVRPPFFPGLPDSLEFAYQAQGLSSTTSILCSLPTFFMQIYR